MSKSWTLETIQQYIDSQVEENSSLDYKSAAALAGTKDKKKEITKDVSAFANAAGGVIIYGVKEYDDSERKHLPEKIDPIDRTQFSKERLEQVINNIRPKIEGVIIHSVSVEQNSTGVIYVVDIPQSTTVHQATDHKYYTRYNFLSVPMEDYQIRDVMNRVKHPRLDISLKTVGNEEEGFCLEVWATNTGDIYAHYVFVVLYLPNILFASPGANKQSNGYYRIALNNAGGMAGYHPILPSFMYPFRSDIGFESDIPIGLMNDLWHVELQWIVGADSAPLRRGRVAFNQIEGARTFIQSLISKDK